MSTEIAGFPDEQRQALREGRVVTVRATDGGIDFTLRRVGDYLHVINLDELKRAPHADQDYVRRIARHARLAAPT